MTVLNNEDPADPSVHEPVETVPWPTVTRYSGGASHEGIGGRVWIRLSDDGPEVEYVPAGALEALQAWRDTVDDMLTVCGGVASDDPWESINRLINWHVSVALDPSVSSDAQALIERGASAERAKADALKTVMIAAAEEIAAHWPAHCDAEGYGPQNLMRRLEEGIPSEYGYTAGAFAELKADADRFLWLTEDHDDAETRAKCRELLGRMAVIGRGAARADIDSAMVKKDP